MDVDKQIVESATILLKFYLKWKYRFRNVEFWGEEAFHQYDEKIAELRNIIMFYKQNPNEL